MSWRPITADEAATVAQNAEPMGGYGWDFNHVSGRWEAGQVYQRPNGERVTVEWRRPRTWDGRAEGPESAFMFVDDRLD